MSDSKVSALTAASLPLLPGWDLALAKGTPDDLDRRVDLLTVAPWQKVATAVSQANDTSVAVTWDATVPHAVRVECYGLSPASDATSITLAADYTINGGSNWVSNGGTSGGRFTEVGSYNAIAVDGTWVLAMPANANDSYLAAAEFLQFGVFETFQPLVGSNVSQVGGRWMGMSVHRSSSQNKYHQTWVSLSAHRTNLGSPTGPMNGFRARLSNNAAIRTGTTLVCWWRPL